jgi:hypothetical protein
MEAAIGRRTWFRLTAFRLGVAAGLGAFFSLVCLVDALLAPAPGAPKPSFDVDIASIGADVSRAGGAALVVRHRDGALIQTCRGRCDDLRYQAYTGETNYDVRVLDPKGACVACDPPRLTGGGYGTMRWEIAGQRPLKIVVSEPSGPESRRTVGETAAK